MNIGEFRSCNVEKDKADYLLTRHSYGTILRSYARHQWHVGNFAGF